MQYLCGLGEFTDQPIFDSSFFVDLRKRISDDDINKMTEALLECEQQMKEEMRKHKEDEAKDRGEELPATPVVDENAAAFADSKGREPAQRPGQGSGCHDEDVLPAGADVPHRRASLQRQDCEHLPAPCTPHCPGKGFCKCRVRCQDWCQYRRGLQFNRPPQLGCLQ